MSSKVDMFRELTTKMADLYAKKNANYGDSYGKLYNTLGSISGLVFLHTKLDRITNLMQGGHNDFESVEDSLMDLANYCLMMMIEMKLDENNK